MLNENQHESGDVIYVPSPVKVLYNYIFSIEENKSGRLQYYRQPVNRPRKRITKNEFSTIYNNKKILAIEPVQKKKMDGSHFLLKFYTL
jgi:hypothetical protein